MSVRETLQLPVFWRNDIMNSALIRFQVLVQSASSHSSPIPFAKYPGQSPQAKRDARGPLNVNLPPEEHVVLHFLQEFGRSLRTVASNIRARTSTTSYSYHSTTSTVVSHSSNPSDEFSFYVGTPLFSMPHSTTETWGTEGLGHFGLLPLTLPIFPLTHDW